MENTYLLIIFLPFFIIINIIIWKYFESESKSEINNKKRDCEMNKIRDFLEGYDYNKKNN